VHSAYLTVGPQGAGKSTFCEELVRVYPGLALLSRDRVFEEVFGEGWHSPYSGAFYVGMKIVWERVAELAAIHDQLILDCWNGTPEERQRYSDKLRSLGATRVEAWHFVTPRDVCLGWYRQKITAEQWCGPSVIEFNVGVCGVNYDKFHTFPVSPNQGFDLVRTIDPTLQDPTMSLLSVA